MAWASALLLSAITLASCTTPTTTQTSAAGGAYVVTASKANFFKYGPAQGAGPDFNLLKGQRVTMVKREFGFSKVQTAEGETGYVATEELAVAPPEVAPAVALPGPSSIFSPRKRVTSSRRVDRNLPQVNDLPLPRSIEQTPDLTADPLQ